MLMMILLEKVISHSRLKVYQKYFFDLLNKTEIHVAFSPNTAVRC